MAAQTNINAFTDISRFGALRNEAGKDPGGAVGKVAREFEALFIEMMLSSARKAAIKGGMFESHALELYKEMFDTQAARVLSEQGTLGFDQAISRFAGIDVNPSPSHPGERIRPDTSLNDSNDRSVDAHISETQEDSNTKAAHTLPMRRSDLPIQNYQTIAVIREMPGATRPNPEISITNSAIYKPSISSTKNGGAGVAAQYDFSLAIAPYAQQAAKELGTEPEILIAQAALETGWGAHIIPDALGASSNNLFGIKANNHWQGEASQVTTLEFLGGRPINTKASFRSYPDMKAAFDDYVSFVKENPRYRKALDNAADPNSYIRELAKAGYATDPNYAEKIISIRNRIEKMNMVVKADIEIPKSALETTQKSAPVVSN